MNKLPLIDDQRSVLLKTLLEENTKSDQDIDHMPKFDQNDRDVLTHLLGKTRFSIGSSNQLISNNPQWKISLGHCV